MNKQDKKLPVHYSKALTRVEHIRRELATVYRLAREGKIETSDMTKFTYTLKTIAELIVRGDLEARLTQLENLLLEAENED